MFIGAIHPGDIVLVQTPASTAPAKFKRALNTKGQRVLAAFRPRERVPLKGPIPEHSHVMLGLGVGLVIHADGKSVCVQKISDVLNGSSDLRYVVYRRNALSTKLASEIADEAMRYYSKSYSFATYFQSPERRDDMKNEDTTQFCSRLVSYAYRRAGIPLTTLADSQVLPLDLYRVCQGSDWQDVTDSFAPSEIGPAADDILGEIDLPGLGKMTFSELMARSDARLDGSAELSLQHHKMMYENTKQFLVAEAILAKYCSAQFDLAKAFRIVPSSIDDDGARMIARTMEQIQEVLMLAHLPSLDALIPRTYLNDSTSHEGRSLFAGFPTPDEVRSLQVNRELIRVFTLLLFAEVGLCSVLAHHMPHANVEAFRVVDSRHVSRFESAIPISIDLSRYEASGYERECFAWVTSESDRAESRKTFKNIVAALQVISLLRQAGARQSAAQ